MINIDMINIDMINIDMINIDMINFLFKFRKFIWRLLNDNLAQQSISAASLKGFYLLAQGNALGNNALLSLRPERAKARYTILCPFRA